ncbi:hypothetical protein CROQUDRAFT_657959 [Cronartium quercuum f. sp. fusiforme G11]|uniref:Uncharacterized protein n=1 Tax=Cronartium quercuum f. sp. fusiforme G11 TaxID=708437 RepID=A0A9P6NFM8_9BASI|nr:hypothetical protein CROQUDRAFT_657959 [Cronartium quercuum f. sp. fusiforme G11]
MAVLGTDEDQSGGSNHKVTSSRVILPVEQTSSSVTSPEKLDKPETTTKSSNDSTVRQDQSDDDNQVNINSDEGFLPPTALRPGVDRETATRFINHAIRTQSIPNDSKRKLEQDEIEERLERGRTAPRTHLPEIRPVIKGGGWTDEDDSDTSDEEDLKVFD